MNLVPRVASCGMLAWHERFDLVPASLFDLWIVSDPDICHALINSLVFAQAVGSGVRIEAGLGSVVNPVLIVGRADRYHNRCACLDRGSSSTGRRGNLYATHSMIDCQEVLRVDVPESPPTIARRVICADC